MPVHEHQPQNRARSRMDLRQTQEVRLTGMTPGMHPFSLSTRIHSMETHFELTPGKCLCKNCRPTRNRAATPSTLPIIVLSALLLLLTFCLRPDTLTAQTHPDVVPAEELGFAPERLQRLPELLHRYVREERLPGGVALILRDGEPVVYEAFGYLDREAGTAMPHDALFRIASQTKAIVSVAVMMLQEEGLLLIHDPVSNYLPEFAESRVAVPNDNGSHDLVPPRRAITIRDLLMHTAGIGYGHGPAADEWAAAGMQGWYFADRDEPIRASVRTIAALPFDAHPGERYVYGYATDILGALVEVVSGQTLDRFLRERIFVPLGMNDTWFYVPERQAHRLATVYSATGNGLERAPDPGKGVGQGHYVHGPRRSFSGGAGLISTAVDYALFLQMLLNGGELNGERLLSPSTVELMTVNHLDGFNLRSGVGFGLGFDVVLDLGLRGLPGAPGDYGWGGAYHSAYWVSPYDQLVVVFFTQLIPAGNSDVHGKLRTLLYQAMIE